MKRGRIFAPANRKTYSFCVAKFIQSKWFKNKLKKTFKKVFVLRKEFIHLHPL